MKTTAFALLFLTAIAFSCHKERPHKGHSCNDCPKDRMCTTEFRTLGLTLKNAAGEPIALDSFRTYQVRTSKFVTNRFSTWEDSVFKSQGNYPYWSDSFTGITQRHGEEVHFLGYKKGEQVVKQILRVGFDCCHVVAESENIEVILNLDN
jgi:hypothetical protein